MGEQTIHEAIAAADKLANTMAIDAGYQSYAVGTRAMGRSGVHPGLRPSVVLGETSWPPSRVRSTRLSSAG